MEMLSAAFEKHQYYNTKDLSQITNQPTVIIYYNFTQYFFYYSTLINSLYLGVFEGNLERVLPLQFKESAHGHVGAQGRVPPVQVKR